MFLGQLFIKLINNKIFASMISQREEEVLDQNIQNMLAASKSKLNTLTGEIDSLTDENKRLLKVLETAESEHKELIQKSVELNANLKKLQAHNEQMMDMKSQLAQELKIEKEKLGKLLDDSEKERSDFNKEMQQLVNEEQKILTSMQKEKQEFEEFQKSSDKRIENLNLSIRQKESEVEELKRLLQGICEKDSMRIQELEEESKHIKKYDEGRKSLA